MGHIHAAAMANMQNMNKDTALQLAHTLSGGKLIDDSTE